ncbi:hypothetical protein NHX12_013891 [Muraenolepis orangiensis]|uniref:Uncharacterized protein n=1 Tax=Muraenolepis orangiensis TaxID=630683 RepID=A0A9Q0DDT9_9TELE|nr:hypothetical protein NHX12_013891 [Muraenolepis orangiensis]
MPRMERRLKRCEAPLLVLHHHCQRRLLLLLLLLLCLLLLLLLLLFLRASYYGKACPPGVLLPRDGVVGDLTPLWKEEEECFFGLGVDLNTDETLGAQPKGHRRPLGGRQQPSSHTVMDGLPADPHLPDGFSSHHGQSLITSLLLLSSRFLPMEDFCERSVQRDQSRDQPRETSLERSVQRDQSRETSPERPTQRDESREISPERPVQED